MSCSLWAYKPEKCDKGYCVGDCDWCFKAQDDNEDGEEVNADADNENAL